MFLLGFQPKYKASFISVSEQPSGNGQLSALVLKRVNNSETVEGPIDRQDAMSRWDKWLSNLRRNRSLILLMVILFFGMTLSLLYFWDTKMIVNN